MPERTDQGRSTLHGAQGVAGAGFQVGEVPSAAIGQLVVLEMTPDVLSGIELGRIGWQLLDLNGAVERFDVFTHECRAMCGKTVPDNQQGIAQLMPEGVEELDDLRALDGTGKEPKVEAAEGNPGDDGELIPIEVVLQDWGVAPRRPSAYPGGPLAQSRLVDEDDDSALFRGVLFRTGQRVCFQRSMAASLRSKARPEGRWQEKPSATRMRQTWLSLYERAKRRAINLPTRGSVHKSVAKPSARAPLLSARINSRRCDSWSPAGRPRRRLFRASNPPPCNRAFHCDTVVRVTLTRRATSAWATPRRSKRPARNRRRCNSSLCRSVLLIARLAKITHHLGQKTSEKVARHLCKSQ